MGSAVGENLDQMHAQSDVGWISVEVAGVTSSPVTISSPIPISGTNRDPDNPLLYEITFTNAASGPQGDYLGLVKVVDTYQTGQNSAPILNSMDGIKRVKPVESPLTGLFDIDEFATYAVFKVEVMPATELPICDIATTPSNATIGVNRNITLDGSGSYDTDGTIQTYEWDFDYDGITFNIDDTGAVVVTQYSTEGDRDAALRVTDDLDASVICTVTVHVTALTIPDVFIPIDNTNIGQNVTIVEDYNGVLHAFYGKPDGGTADETSNITWAYSDDYGNTWKGHVKIYDTTGSQFHVHQGDPNSEMVMADATDSPKIYLSWIEIDYAGSNFQERVMAGSFDISDLNSPSLSTIEVFREPLSPPNYFFPGAQIIATSDDEIMMYYMSYQYSAWFVAYYKFASSFSMLTEASTPSSKFSDSYYGGGYITNGQFIYIYHSTSPLFAVDSHDNIFFTISGRFAGISNPYPPPSVPDYDTGYGSVLLRYNNSGDYSSGNNWDIMQHYGRSGCQFYWDNWTQALNVDENDNIHWVFEYEINGDGDSNVYGDYSIVYATGPSTAQLWQGFTYTDPIPGLTDSGAKTIAEFLYTSVDTNSQGEVWITYQDASSIPEIYYTYYDGSWHTPTVLTVPPMDQGYYPYMFVSSWDGMYVVFCDGPTSGHPWLKAIDTL